MNADVVSHYKRVQYVLWIVLVLNWSVAAAKILYGLLTRCSSMTADGFHSLSDGASNILGLVGAAICAKPSDADHPYGHKKYETLFALGIAGMIFFVAFNLVGQGISRLINPVTPRIDIISFITMIATMAVNFGVMKYEYKQGSVLKSDILVSDSMHTRADLFTSFTVIIALIGAKLGWHHLDPIATLIISVFIGYAAFDIVRHESGILCDATAIGDIKKIEEIVLGIKGVKSCHKIRSRGRPDDIHLDLHVQLAPNTHLDKAHEISFLIENTIKRQMPEVADVLVHLEPVGKEDLHGRS